MLAKNSHCSRFSAASRTLYASASVARIDSYGFRSPDPRPRAASMRLIAERHGIGAPRAPNHLDLFVLALPTSACKAGFGSRFAVIPWAPPLAHVCTCFAHRPIPTSKCRPVRR
jgi:hypothetical protein